MIDLSSYQLYHLRAINLVLYAINLAQTVRSIACRMSMGCVSVTFLQRNKVSGGSVCQYWYAIGLTVREEEL